MINLEPNEKILYQESPGKGLIGYWFVTRALGFSFIFILAFGWLPFILKILGREYILIMYLMFGFIFIFIIITSLYYILLVKTHEYYITNKRIYAQAGLFSKRSRNINFNKITDITIHQNIFEKMFNISNLGVQTAGMSGRPEITFLGIKDPTKPEKLLRKMKKRLLVY